MELYFSAGVDGGKSGGSRLMTSYEVVLRGLAGMNAESG